MAINIRVNLAVIVATIAGELVSWLWQSDALPWSRYEDHYLISSVCANFVLALIMHWITSSHWGVRKLEDALWLSVCVTMVYAALTAPQTVYGPRSLIALGFISLHKFLVIFAMTASMYLIKKHN